MKHWHQNLICPECSCSLPGGETAFTCPNCKQSFPLQDGCICFLPGDGDQKQLLASTDGKVMVQGYRKPGRLIRGLRRVISSEFFPGKGWRRARAAVLDQQDGFCLVIGSGITRYPRAIHLDIDDFPGVDLVADAQKLPFADNSIDSVLCEVVLEHVPDARAVIDQAWRVLKPGGRFFFIVPFLFPYHGHPSDFRRWSRQGLLREFGAFQQLEVGIHGGPCSSMVNLMSEWAYVLSGLPFPRGYTLIKGLATLSMFPVKYLDLLINRFPEAHRLASTLYITGSKPQD